MVDTPERFVALDVHKQYVVIAAVDYQQQIVLQPRRVNLDRFDGWIAEHLHKNDAVVLEATTNVWQFYDQLEPVVNSVTIAHSLKVALITSSRSKTCTTTRRR